MTEEALRFLLGVLQDMYNSLEAQLTIAENIRPETMESLNNQVILRNEMSAVNGRIGSIEHRLEREDFC